MPEISFLEALTILALISGPIFAVLVTRFIDHAVDRRKRKIAIFRDLMLYRRIPLSSGFVSALNLIELEFRKNKTVIDSFNELMENFSKEWPQKESEQHQLMNERQTRTTALIMIVGGALRIKTKMVEISEGGYIPLVWHNNEQQEREKNRLINEILNGNRVLSVNLVLPENNNDQG